jgi:hypothetical protein
MATLLPLLVKMDGKPITCRARDILGHKIPKTPLSSNLKLQNCPFKQNKRTEWYIPRPPPIIIQPKYIAIEPLAPRQNPERGQATATTGHRSHKLRLPENLLVETIGIGEVLAEEFALNNAQTFTQTVLVIKLFIPYS